DVPTNSRRTGHSTRDKIVLTSPIGSTTLAPSEHAGRFLFKPLHSREKSGDEFYSMDYHWWNHWVDCKHHHAHQCAARHHGQCPCRDYRRAAGGVPAHATLRRWHHQSKQLQPTLAAPLVARCRHPVSSCEPRPPRYCALTERVRTGESVCVAFEE